MANRDNAGKASPRVPSARREARGGRGACNLLPLRTRLFVTGSLESYCVLTNANAVPSFVSIMFKNVVSNVMYNLRLLM